MKLRTLCLIVSLAAGCATSLDTEDAGVPGDSAADVARADNRIVTDVPPAPTCATGETMCGAACANTQNDRMNCGACNTACPGGQMCVAGACVIDCASPNRRCTAAGMMSCVNTDTDTSNCGGCGTACPAGEACVAGVCGCAPGQTRCGTRCVATLTDNANCGTCGNACSAAQNCVAGACACPPGQTACGPACVMLPSDPSNCGGCGTVCPSGQMCVSGNCQIDCPSPGILCFDAAGTMQCNDVQNDVSNCGACGNACAMTANSVPSCAAGTCASACLPDFANCDGNDANGCESDLRASVANCGACGRACTVAGQTCIGGGCACPVGLTACSGACVNTQTNSANCGVCGRVCTGGATCSAGACVGGAPANDSCVAAQTIGVSFGQVTASGSTISATHDPFNTTCSTSAPEVWYRFTLTQREYVYADTFGSAYDTNLGIFASCASAAITCNDDTCGVLQSQVTGVLDPGTYYIAVGGYSTSRGAFTMHFQHIPVMPGSNSSGLLAAGASTVSGSTVTGMAGAFCGGAPARWYHFVTCPGYAGGAFTATTCATGGGSASYDTQLGIRNGDGAGQACVDDSCGLQSTVTSTASAGPGIHALFVGGFSSNTGTYSVRVSRP